MFFRGLREAKRAARNEARTRFETQLETALAGVEKIEKPADQLLKLEEIRQSADNKLNSENNSLTNKTDFIDIAGAGSGVVGGMAAGIGDITL